MAVLLPVGVEEQGAADYLGIFVAHKRKKAAPLRGVDEATRALEEPPGSGLTAA